MADPVSEALFAIELLSGSSAVGEAAAFIAANAAAVNTVLAITASPAYGVSKRTTIQQAADEPTDRSCW